ncbi:MAG: VCBS repeat-containing protein [Planctomycetes bacterium]|nr:VCBS repeat-containing protein [Planctomycetota bacterium]
MSQRLTSPRERQKPWKNALHTSVNRGRNVVYWSIGAAIGLFLVLLFLASRDPLHSAELALSSGEFREALRLSAAELARDQDSSQALLIAGFAAQGLNQPDVAIRYFARVRDEGNSNTIRALLPLADHALRNARPADAERALRRVLDLDPSHLDACDRLIYVLVLEGRIWEAQQFILRVLQSGRVEPNHLLVIGSNKTELGDSDAFAAACLATVPDDPLPLLTSARRAYRDNDVKRARNLLEQITSIRPEILEAQALLGTLVAEAGEIDAFVTWQTRLPAHADDHPGIWYGRGVWAVKTSQREAAIRCFVEALIRQPNHVAANYQLSQVLTALGRESQATRFGNRARDLSRLELLVGEAQLGGTLDKSEQVVQLLESLGRLWEAAAWCYAIQAQGSQQAWPRQTLRRLSPLLDQCHSFVADSANLTLHFDLARYPLPDWNRRAKSLSPSDSSNAVASRVTFTNEADRTGLKFTYQNGATSGDSESMFEFDGGGVAVLDFDRDQWPDIYLTQGGTLPPEAAPRTSGDCLYRNIEASHFVDVTAQAGLGDTAFSQGVSVGDFNSDGFPDVYIANIGPNTFYRNNGDGTFDEVSRLGGTAGDEWTSSCVLADVNGDALPDLYVVNYLAGDELRTHRCNRNSPQRCHPSMYGAAQDRLYLNLGDGRFEDMTSRAGIADDDGRGLGVIAADFDSSRRISLFVGNDMSRNFLFANQTPSRGATPLFTEQGLLRGVAVDSRGIPKAAMGIAAGDANGDGLLDLFVTNFHRESNNLYLQQSDHTFWDATREANLSESGFHMLGWGTQFMDGELDGFPDLILTNGHVHKPSDSAVPYQMPPQYFRNKGNCRFEELRGETLGAFFQGKYLGRALARLDWNRDGLEEACICHLDSPTALLLNGTSEHGHFLAVDLVGTRSDRDAIGTIVEIVADGRQWTRQLTGGDGYQACNQRSLVFGLGAAQHITQLQVHWPTGQTQTFTNLPVDCEIILIEGRSDEVKVGP